MLSLETVRNRVSAVLAKLGVSTRAGAVVKARPGGPGGLGGPHAHRPGHQHHDGLHRLARQRPDPSPAIASAGISGSQHKLWSG